MAIQPTQLNLLQTQSGISNPTVGSGVSAGTVFNGRGTDFLSPNSILRTVNGFSGSLTPITSNTFTAQISPANPLGKNPTASQILNASNGSLSSILNQNFSNIRFPVELAQGPFALPVPELGNNPDATKIAISTAFFTSNLQASSALGGGLNDPRNFMPQFWQNPNANQILLGTLQAQNALLGGTGLLNPGIAPGQFGAGAFSPSHQSIVGFIPVIPVVGIPVSTNTTGALPVSQPAQSGNAYVALMMQMLNSMNMVLSTLLGQLLQNR